MFQVTISMDDVQYPVIAGSLGQAMEISEEVSAMSNVTDVGVGVWCGKHGWQEVGCLGECCLCVMEWWASEEVS